MNILITGGSGFIGRNLIEGLKNNYKIFAPSHSGLDITDSKSVRKYLIKNKIKVVIHTAVKGGDDVLENILRMFLSIYNNLDLIDRFINFGSGAEYGKTRHLKRIEETELGKFIPEDNYGLGKLICSKIAMNNKKIVTLIPFGIFGRYENYKYTFISNSIVKNLFGLPIIIKQNSIFDYLFADDLISIVEHFVKNKKYSGDFNITPSDSISLEKITQLINSVAKTKSKIIVKNKGLNFQYTGNNSKLKTILPDLTFFEYRWSVKNLYDFYSSRLASLDRSAIIQDDYFKIAKIK